MRTETIGTRLRRLRTERGLTQRELAAGACTRAHVATVEAGRASPSAELLGHFAAVLGLTAAELLTGPASRSGSLAEAWLTGSEPPETTSFWGACCAAQRLPAAEAARAFAAAATLPDADAVYATARRIGCLTEAGEPEYAAHLGEAALLALPEHPDPEHTGWLCAALQEPYHALDQHERALELRQRALALLHSGPPPETAARMLIAHGSPDRALALLVRWPLERLLTAQPRLSPAASLAAEGAALAAAGRYDDAMTAFEAAYAELLRPSRPLPSDPLNGTR
ncbi:helix-turn-helix domain-containing protein [Longispora albida]|uniref:helix-turn-helix domain-containing protein n=1 Tax=Longispora albida TaxID=203523 RepID=UPI000362F703|nr:helix-turn-helix transcriptional regulator [Longispora albida]